MTLETTSHTFIPDQNVRSTISDISLALGLRTQEDVDDDGSASDSNE